jgi:hypothetical protein
VLVSGLVAQLDSTIGEHVRGCAFESHHVQVSLLYLLMCRVEKDDASPLAMSLDDTILDMPMVTQRSSSSAIPEIGFYACTSTSGV